MSKYVIDATSVLLNDSNKAVVANIASDLSKIKKRCKYIDEIVVRGGCAVDALRGITPNDVDLFYSYKAPSGVFGKKCICNKVKKDISNLRFKYFKDKEIDLENAYEKEPRLSPIDRTVGPFLFILILARKLL